MGTLIRTGDKEIRSTQSKMLRPHFAQFVQLRKITPPIITVVFENKEKPLKYR